MAAHLCAGVGVQAQEQRARRNGDQANHKEGQAKVGARPSLTPAGNGSRATRSRFDPL
jgi:hypothetical protein